MDTGDVVPVPEATEATEATSIEPLVDNTITDTPVDYFAPL